MDFRPLDHRPMGNAAGESVAVNATGEPVPVNAAGEPVPMNAATPRRHSSTPLLDATPRRHSSTPLLDAAGFLLVLVGVALVVRSLVTGLARSFGMGGMV